MYEGKIQYFHGGENERRKRKITITSKHSINFSMDEKICIHWVW
jgi:hypothetical protein